MIKPIHPDIQMPYGEWFVISSQVASGALWRLALPIEKIMMINELHDRGKAWVMLRKGKDGAYERVAWLKRPPETT